MPYSAFAALRAGASLEPYSYEPAPLGPLDVEVAISHCGVCHSDLHLLDGDWGMQAFPFVPGHEIVGYISAVGSEVRDLRKAQRVGIGWQSSACLKCEDCIAGNEHQCAHSRATCVGAPGGFGEKIRVDSRFVFPLPAALPSASAAPLLCAGITAYAALKYYDVGASTRVGVIGIGGMGHLALQFARALGCEVTAFSMSASKEAEARLFGASRFVVTSEPGAMSRVANSLDFIVSTVAVPLDWGAVMGTLRKNGRLCLLAAPGATIQLPVMPLLMGRRSVCGSSIGGRAMMREMLEFAASHGVRAKTEAMPMNQAQAAIERLREGTPRYRVVLIAEANTVKEGT